MAQTIWYPGDRIVFGILNHKGTVIRVNESITMADGEHPIEVQLDGKKVPFNFKSNTLTRIED